MFEFSVGIYIYIKHNDKRRILTYPPTLIVKKRKKKISVEQDRVVTTINIIKH
jgi:hypothetical protein